MVSPVESLTTFIIDRLPSKKYDPFKSNSLLLTSLPYYLLPLIILLGMFVLETHAWTFVLIIYTLLPYVDEVFSQDTVNPTQNERKYLQGNDTYFRWALFTTIILDWALFFRIMNHFATLTFTPAAILNLIALLFIYSNLSAVQFAIAHQIFHKPGAFNKGLGTLHMVKNLYMHFTYEHIYGHHRRVSTPEDPAFARKDIDVYSFAVGSFLGGYKSVYEMELEAKKPFWKNCAVLSVVAAIGFTAAMFLKYGNQAGVLFLIQAIGSVFYLQAINYIEHYGLLRDKLPNGQYEKVTIRHSWNAPHRFSNYLLYKLQRHSDHHENALKPYQTLVSLDQSPQLPHGYSLTILLSLFPSVWYQVMNPLVDQYSKLKVGNVEGEVRRKSMDLIKRFACKFAIFVSVVWTIQMIAIQ